MAWTTPPASEKTVSPLSSYRYDDTRPNGLVWRVTRPAPSYSLTNAATPSPSTTEMQQRPVPHVVHGPGVGGDVLEHAVVAVRS